VCSFIPSVNVSGEVSIERGIDVCRNRSKKLLLNIVKIQSLVPGAVVAKTLPSNCTAVGIPTKPIKFHK
jgi:hypothetical protein